MILPTIHSSGHQAWYRERARHRDEGPAIIWPGGSQFWYQEGKLHRKNGPAIIRPNGHQYWWPGGVMVSV
jgi:hypothetical protein